MKAQRSPYGMLLKDLGHLFDEVLVVYQCSNGHLLETVFFQPNCMASLSTDGTFYLWETNTWTSEQWSSSSGFVTGAQWDRDGRIILLAFSGSLTLGSVHFSSKPPSLDAHLLPVDLPEIMSLTGSHGIDKVAWDAACERLAVSYKGGDEAYNGLIAIYDTRRTPLISASLMYVLVFSLPLALFGDLEKTRVRSHSRFITSLNKGHCFLWYDHSEFPETLLEQRVMLYISSDLSFLSSPTLVFPGWIA
ncbi:AAAS [Linum perenne]